MRQFCLTVYHVHRACALSSTERSWMFIFCKGFVVVLVPHHSIVENQLADCGNAQTPVVKPASSTNPADQSYDSNSGSESLPATPVLTTPVSRCGSVGFSLGTPIEAADSVDDTSYSSAKTLPDRSHFAVGMTDHILFENLPNATGTFQRLRKIIQSLHWRSASSLHRLFCITISVEWGAAAYWPDISCPILFLFHVIICYALRVLMWFLRSSLVL